MSNLRTTICLDKVIGISKAAWNKVTDHNPDILNTAVMEVTDKGKIIDQVKERLAGNMFTESVEQMRENGHMKVANF